MYTYSDNEVVETHNKTVVIAVVIVSLFVLFLLILIGIGLSRGDRLEFDEKPFTTYSTDSAPSATCLEYHKQVISTMDIYNDFVDACNWTVSDEFVANGFNEGVAVIYFIKDTSYDQPFAFYDYPFMVDGFEVIRVRDRRWENPNGDWFVYYVYMTKDQIGSSSVTFD